MARVATRRVTRLPGGGKGAASAKKKTQPSGATDRSGMSAVAARRKAQRCNECPPPHVTMSKRQTAAGQGTAARAVASARSHMVKRKLAPVCRLFARQALQSRQACSR
jgi:hypothetical protein